MIPRFSQKPKSSDTPCGSTQPPLPAVIPPKTRFFNLLPSCITSSFNYPRYIQLTFPHKQTDDIPLHAAYPPNVLTTFLSLILLRLRLLTWFFLQYEILIRIP